ncbi:PREDICTED: UDP-glycosyltransferase 87A1-like [Nelumbo nucifera]|uniref:UDP-glycosyltransferase 87A1-like n=1 Tax=Nelumbo nucifera TaxID=4432 RepID=A0A1U7ZS27_NELNU|nr:PREDICTED: UDP-glycosyltransferase 87A1-like [Nelumbo nucifera]
MDSVKAQKTSGCHLVAIPYPGRGHVNPMMNLCKLIASRGDDILITLVVTEEWLDFIGSSPEQAKIRFRSIPNVIPSERIRALDFPGFVEAVYTKMGASVEQLLDQLEPSATAIVADTYLPWAVSIGNRRNIPVGSLWTMSPSVFSLFYHFDLLSHNGHFPADLSERGGECIDYIPGISPIRLKDIPNVFSEASRLLLNRVIEAFNWVVKAQCLLVTSFYEMDTHVIDTLRTRLPFPVYPVGPSIPYATLVKDSPSTTTTLSDADCYYFKWLDSQPRSCVLYVSMGSFLSTSSEQMEEIAAGLHDSGVRYLWVAREDASRFQETCGETGLVVPWCDQLRVLCHPSVGGFWTHCGWNSTLEAVFAGVPMLTFPILFDQFTDSKLIADDWKIGWRVTENVGADTLVKREDIANLVRKFMDHDGSETKEMRRRAREIQESCQRAIEKGGSSETNLSAFLRGFLQCHVS